MLSPQRRLQTERQKLDEMSRRWSAAQLHRVELLREKFKGIENHLLALSPQAVLKRGFAIIMKEQKVVSSTKQVRPDDALQVRVGDGEFHARVTENG